jgi:hypothetical protein
MRRIEIVHCTDNDLTHTKSSQIYIYIYHFAVSQKRA